jgi:hypothetical protein
LQQLEAEFAQLKTHAAAAPNDSGLSQAAGPGEPDRTASRRDLIRAGGAVALGAAMTILPGKRAEAANGDPITVGGNHTGTLPTSVTLTTTGANNNAAIHGSATAPTGDNFGLWGETNSVAGAGVVGNSNATTGVNAGVYGETNSGSGAGVVGNANSDEGAGIGVMGWCHLPQGNAVVGNNYGGGTAILGQLPSDVDANGIGVCGANYSSYAGPGPGAGGFGAYGFSLKGHGLVGATGTPGGAALVGASNGIAGAYAAAFYGPVVITGDLAVVGAKSAAVAHPDGVYRRVYCVESPESWFEEFGKGELLRGSAEITIDPQFTAIADMDDYHVFVSGYDSPGELMVSERTPCGFRVTAKDPAGTNAFSWRLVARRKDIAGERLAPVTIPPKPAMPPGPPNGIERRQTRRLVVSRARG